MPIQYALFENNLTSDPDDYMAMVQPIGTADLDAIIERMIKQGSTVTKADTLSVLEDYFTAVESMVVEGVSVTAPLANFGASIKGVFNGQTDSFNKTALHGSGRAGCRRLRAGSTACLRRQRATQ